MSDYDAVLAQVDDDAHKIVASEEEMRRVFAFAAVMNYPVKVANGLPVLLVDDTDDLWVVDVVKAVRRGRQ